LPLDDFRQPLTPAQQRHASALGVDVGSAVWK
jgi:hypothetical protein